MPELVGDLRLAPLVLRQPVGVAAVPVLHADLHLAGREHLLERHLRHLAGREGVVGDQRRLLGEGHGHVGLRERVAVERAEVALLRRGGPLARAERLLAADVERELGPEPALGLAQEAGEPAEMVVVAVAQHQRVERSRVDAEQGRVVDQRLGREAVVDQDVPDLVAAPALDVHREAELADQRPARRLVGESPQPKRSMSTLPALALGATAIW